MGQIPSQAALATEQSELYKQLRAPEECIRSILEQNYFGVALTNLEGQLTAVNPAFVQVTVFFPTWLCPKLAGSRHTKNCPKVILK